MCIAQPILATTSTTTPGYGVVLDVAMRHLRVGYPLATTSITHLLRPDSMEVQVSVEDIIPQCVMADQASTVGRDTIDERLNCNCKMTKPGEVESPGVLLSAF